MAHFSGNFRKLKKSQKLVLKGPKKASEKYQSITKLLKQVQNLPEKVENNPVYFKSELCTKKCACCQKVIYLQATAISTRTFFFSLAGLSAIIMCHIISCFLFWWDKLSVIDHKKRRFNTFKKGLYMCSLWERPSQTGKSPQWRLSHKISERHRGWPRL